LRESAGFVRGEDGRPDVLARLDRIVEVRTGAVDLETMAVECQADLVLSGASHPRGQAGGAGLNNRHATAQEVSSPRFRDWVLTDERTAAASVRDTTWADIIITHDTGH